MSIPSPFLRSDRIRGIVIIRNLKTDEIFLLKTEDAVKSFKDERFKLDLEMHPVEGLQSAYTALGLELFTIELEQEAKENESLDALLKERTDYYLSLGYHFYS